MLFPCDEILVIDHDSDDGTVNVAREYGARVVKAKPSISYAEIALTDWILTLDPRESVTEALAASLFEWKGEEIPAEVRAFSMYRRDETMEGWVANPVAQTRLVRADWNLWTGHFPKSDAAAVALEGDLLHFEFP